MRDKFGRFIKGNKHSPEVIKKISENSKNFPRNYWLGKKMPKSMRIKMSLAKKGKPLTQKHKENISKAFLGYKHPLWKGGRHISKGYVFLYKPDHPFCNCYRYVREHKIVIENIIGRYLTSKEDIHHLNKVKHDNRPSNLIAFSNKSAHQRFHKNPDNVNPEEIIFDGSKSHCCSYLST